MPNSQRFDVQGARKSGYSDDEILDHLQQSRKFDIQGALKEGYSKSEIIDHLAGMPTVSAPQKSPAELANEALAQNPKTARTVRVAGPQAPAAPKMRQVDVMAGAFTNQPPIEVSEHDENTAKTMLPWDVTGQVKAGAERLTAGPREGAKVAGQYIQAEANAMDDNSLAGISAPVHSYGGAPVVNVPGSEIAHGYKNVVAPAAQRSAQYLEGQYEPQNLALLSAFSALPQTTAATRLASQGAGAVLGIPAVIGAGEQIGSGIHKLESGDVAGGVYDLAGAVFDTGMAIDTARGAVRGAKQSAQDLQTVGQQALETRPAQAVVRGAQKTGGALKEGARTVASAISPEKYMTAEQAATKAFKPRNAKANWQNEISNAMPYARRAADDLGINVENMTLDDALRSVQKARNDVWQEYAQNYLDPSRPFTTDTTSVAQAMRDTISERMREQTPGLARKIERNASTYDTRNMDVTNLQKRLHELNNETRSIEAKYTRDKAAAKMSPKNAYKFAERDTLRELLNKSIGEVTGESGGEAAQQLRRDYGALGSVEDVIHRHIPVAGRRNPVSLTRLLGDLSGYGTIAAGAMHGNIPMVLSGVAAKLAARQAEKLNDPEFLTQQAFKKTAPADAPLEPSEYMPEPGAYTATVPRFIRAALPPSMRDRGVPEQPIVDPVTVPVGNEAIQNPNEGSMNLGPTGLAGRLIRKRGLLPAAPPEVEAQAQPQPTPESKGVLQSPIPFLRRKLAKTVAPEAVAEQAQPVESANVHAQDAMKYASADDFLKAHKTGHIGDDAYKDMRFDFLKKSEHPVLVKSVRLKDGSAVELRQSGETNKYTKTDENGRIVRDENGLATYLSPEEVQAKGLPEKDETVVAFDKDGNAVGYASDEWGADGVWVAPSMQRKGLGTELLYEFRKQYPPSRQIGQMTSSGVKMAKSYYERLVNEAKNGSAGSTDNGNDARTAPAGNSGKNGIDKPNVPTRTGTRSLESANKVEPALSESEALRDLHATYGVTESHVRDLVKNAGLEYKGIWDTSASRNGLQVMLQDPKTGSSYSVAVDKVLEPEQFTKAVEKKRYEFANPQIQPELPMEEQAAGVEQKPVEHPVAEQTVEPPISASASNSTSKPPVATGERSQESSSQEKSNPFQSKAEAARAKADKLNAPTAHEAGMAKSFPLGGGFGRKGAAKRIDASVDRAVAATKAEAEAKAAEAKAAAFEAGKIDDGGKRVGPSIEKLRDLVAAGEKWLQQGYRTEGTKFTSVEVENLKAIVADYKKQLRKAEKSSGVPSIPVLKAGRKKVAVKTEQAYGKDN